MKGLWFVVCGAALLVSCTGSAPTAGPTLPRVAPSAAPTTVFGPPATTAAPPEPSEPASDVPVHLEANGIGLAEPACDGTLTPEQGEGPYYIAGSPERYSLLEPDMAGTRLLVVGYVLDAGCQPIPGALLDFWQANDAGEYDNAGYTLRGRQFTDPQGRYFLETIVPAEYPGRPQHIHVKVQPPGGEVLTSQLYFPGSNGGGSSALFSPETVVTIEDRGDYRVAYYNFVVE